MALLLTGALASTLSDAQAQTRDLGAERLIIDDGAGTGTMTISYEGPGNFELVIPPGQATAVPVGTVAGQTLAWNGDEWVAMGNLMNNGGLVTLTGTSGPLFSSTNSGSTGSAATLELTHPDNISSAVLAIATQGAGIEAVSTDGPGGFFVSDNYLGMIALSETNTAGAFAVISGTNDQPAVIGVTLGTSNAAEFIVDNSSNDSSAVEVLTTGPGVAVEAMAPFGTAGLFAGEVGLQVNAGSMIGSTATYSEGDPDFPLNQMIVHVTDNNDASFVQVVLPNGAEGQILIVTTDDAEGVDFVGQPFFLGSFQMRTLVYTNGSWYSTP